MSSDHDRIEDLEAAVAEAGTAKDKPHQDMAHEAAVDEINKRLGVVEAAVEAAGTAQDEPHHEMAHEVADATVAANARSQRVMLTQMQSSVLTNVRWFVALAACALFVGYLIAR